MILGEHVMDLRRGRRRESTASSRLLVLVARKMASCFSLGPVCCTASGFFPLLAMSIVSSACAEKTAVKSSIERSREGGD